jgi:5-methylcytosine-specific restriction endonuclease McrA
VLARERAECVATDRPTEKLVDAAVRSIPGMVMQKFHNLPGQGEVAHRFYELDKGSGAKRIVRLTPELRAVAADHSGVLGDELDARWKIVETSFDAGIGRNLLGGLQFDATNGQLTVGAQRVPLTGLRSSIDGFQYGRCFYCREPLGNLHGPDVEVDHVFPFKWMTTGSWREPDLNGVWNLVLAHKPCNRTKWVRPPTDDEIARLIARNDAIAESPKPLRRTLELSMKASGPGAAEKRRQFIVNVQKLTTEG